MEGNWRAYIHFFRGILEKSTAYMLKSYARSTFYAYLIDEGRSIFGSGVKNAGKISRHQMPHQPAHGVIG